MNRPMVPVAAPSIAMMPVNGIPETNAGLLAALQPLGKDEILVYRWIIAPGRPSTVPVARAGSSIETEERRRLRVKNSGSIVRARGLVAIRAGHVRRAEHLVGRLQAMLRSQGTAYGYVSATARLKGQTKLELATTSFFLMDRYAGTELAALLGWSIEAPQLPGIMLGTSPLRIPSSELPSSGRVLGVSTWPGRERPVAQSLVGALSHSLITGPTGSGKSTLLTQLAVADLAAGRGLVLIDGKGDTVDEVLARVPERRQRDDPIIGNSWRHLPKDQRKDRAERLCNYFAACLLMPRKWIKSDWGNGIQRVRQLSRRYYVSEDAMSTRLSELGLTSMTLALEPKQRHDRSTR